MRNPEQTVGNLIDKQSICYGTSVASDGVDPTVSDSVAAWASVAPAPIKSATVRAAERAAAFGFRESILM